MYDPYPWLFADVPSASGLPGLQAAAAVPAAAVTSLTAAAAAVADSVAASAAAAAEAARVKDLEARLAQIEAQSSLLQAQNLRLTSELEKAQHLSQEGTRMASLVQPPSNWQAHAQGQTLLFVELPVPDHAKQECKLTDAQLKSQHKGWFADMRTNEVDMNDALAALRSDIHCCPAMPIELVLKAASGMQIKHQLLQICHWCVHGYVGSEFEHTAI